MVQSVNVDIVCLFISRFNKWNGMTTEQLEYERRYNPLCLICQCRTEKFKITRKNGNICAVCYRNDQELKRLKRCIKKKLGVKLHK